MAEEQSRRRRSKQSNVNVDAATNIIGRVPPHSIEMERAVLCAGLIDPNGMAKVVDILDERSFYERRHQMIFAAMRRLFNRSIPIDLLTVSDELKTSGELDSVGGDAYLAQLAGEVATSAHAEYYARTVQDRYALRELIYSSARITEEAFDVPPAAELLDKAMSSIFDIYSNRRTGGFVPLLKIVNEAFELIDSQHKKHDTNITGIGTGFKELDDLTSGFQNGELIVIASRPSMGKTAFSLDLARHAAQMYGKRIAYFSLEMSSQTICLRMLSAQSSIEHKRIRNPVKLKDDEIRILADAAGKLADMDFFIDDTGSLGITELRARARRLAQTRYGDKEEDRGRKGIDIIFVDYLQLMQPPKADSREQEVAQISRALKGLARELNIPVVAMSQLSRAVEARGGEKIPQLADLRDSGAIEQDADVVMFIHRKKQYKSGLEGEEDDEPVDNSANIIIRKQRNGPTGTVELVFNDIYTRFDNKESSGAMSAPVKEKSVSKESPETPEPETVPF